MAGMVWAGVCICGQDAWAPCRGVGDDVLALGLEDGVALVASSTSHHTLLRGCGRDLTFLTALQVSEYVRIRSHDMYMTRSGCWLMDERMGTGDVGEAKPRKTGFS